MQASWRRSGRCGGRRPSPNVAALLASHLSLSLSHTHTHQCLLCRPHHCQAMDVRWQHTSPSAPRRAAPLPEPFRELGEHGVCGRRLSTSHVRDASFDASTVGEGAMGEAAALCEGAGWHGAFREAVLKLSAASTSVGG